ncbi:MAG: hypothetical protein JNK78_17425 [Planctomycetes bacterium]|nr:hypothetical protein [Planctomycetota bacterium]
MRWPWTCTLGALVALLAWLSFRLLDPASPSPAADPAASSPGADTDPAKSAPGAEPVRNDAAAPSVPPLDAASAIALTAVLPVRVVDARGSPLPGCRVRAMVRTQIAAEAPTDDEGRARLTLPHGRHRLDVTPADERFAPIDGYVTVEPGIPELRIVLEDRARLPFCVRLSIGAPPQPFAGARATLQRHGGAADEMTSDPDGVLKMLAGDHRDTLDVAATAASGPCFVVPAPGYETRATALAVTVPAAASLTVRAVDSADRLLADRTVAIAIDSRSATMPAGAFTRRGVPPAETRTGAAGTAEFPMLPAGVTVTAELRDEDLPAPPSASLRLEPGVNTVTLRVESSSVHGVVRDDSGNGLAGVAVGVEYWSSERAPPAMRTTRAGPRLVSTDEAGRFVFARLGPGRWLVGVVPFPDREPPLEPVCSVVETVAGVDTNVDLRTRPGGFIDAVTVLADGTAAGGVSVDLQSAEEPARYVTTVRSDQEGRVRLGPLPRGDWTLTTDVFDARLGLLAPVRVRTGDTGVRLVLYPTMVDVRIDVSDELGRPRRAAVWMRHRAQQDAIGFGTGLDGRREHRGLRAGTWDVLADDDAGNVAWLDGVELVPGDQPARLRLELRRGSTVVVPCPADEGLEIWCVRGTHVGFNDMVVPHDVRRITLPEGAWTIELRRGQTTVRRSEVQLRAGREHSVSW